MKSESRIMITIKNYDSIYQKISNILENQIVFYVLNLALNQELASHCSSINQLDQIDEILLVEKWSNKFCMIRGPFWILIWVGSDSMRFDSIRLDLNFFKKKSDKKKFIRMTVFAPQPLNYP